MSEDQQSAGQVTAHRWSPIADLPEGWQDLCREDLRAVHSQWLSDRDLIRDEEKLRSFQEELAMHWAIETGLIERLYTAERGITVQIAKAGLEALGEFHARGKLSRDARALITDQREALEMVMDVVGGSRELTTWYVKELHQRLTLSQKTCEALDQFGTTIHVPLLKGQWKQQPNNPKRRDGSIHEYCPPERVQDEMEKLLDWHRVHEERLRDAPEVLAAWLHHRFTQIHPFQDGNGRVARALTAAVFLKADHLVLVIRDQEDRDRYLNALASADAGDLGPLVDLFADVQKADLDEAIKSLRELRGKTMVAAASSLAQRVRRITTERSEESLALMDSLTIVAKTRLAEAVAELRHAFASEGVQVEARLFEDAGRERWWYSQIVEAAKKHGYFAQLEQPRRWVSLQLRLLNGHSEDAKLVVSFHAVGRAANLNAATAFLTGKAETGDDSPGWWNITLAERPFNFGLRGFQQNDEGAQQKRVERFRDWLDHVIEAGLTKWGERL